MIFIKSLESRKEKKNTFRKLMKNLKARKKFPTTKYIRIKIISPSIKICNKKFQPKNYTK